ncbi:MAG: hypothetical protein AAB347_02175 [Bacteroidota bacterium]
MFNEDTNIFAPYQDVVNTDLSKTIYGKINYVQNILYKNILPLSTAISDSIGHDRAMLHQVTSVSN